MDNNISLIITVYKDIESLKIILDSIMIQTILPSEIIITEDGNFTEMNIFIKNYNTKVSIIHLNQADNGWGKNRALNEAIKSSNFKYLIFIDGDCFINIKFIESTIKLREKNTILCGRRVNIGNSFSTGLKNGNIQVIDFLNNYKKLFFKLKKDSLTRFEEGLYINPSSFIYKFYRKFIKKDAHLLGCCWSGYKKDFYKINGFDEDFNMPTVGEDTDMERRMRDFGIKFKTSKFAANVFHLDHKKNFNREIHKTALALMETKKHIFFCKNGLTKN